MITKNEFCRSAKIKDGAVLINGINENCVEIDEYSGKAWDMLCGDFTLKEIHDVFKRIDNRISDDEIYFFVKEMIKEGFLIEK